MMLSMIRVRTSSQDGSERDLRLRPNLRISKTESTSTIAARVSSVQRYRVEEERYVPSYTYQSAPDVEVLIFCYKCRSSENRLRSRFEAIRAIRSVDRLSSSSYPRDSRPIWFRRSIDGRKVWLTFCDVTKRQGSEAGKHEAEEGEDPWEKRGKTQQQ